MITSSIKQLTSVLLLVLVNGLGFSILIPVMPIMLHRWDVDSAFYGIIVSVYNFAMFWASQLFGEYSDQYGRRRLILISHIGTLISWFIFVFLWFIDIKLQVPVFWLLIILLGANLVNGLTGGNNSVANAYMADITPPHKRPVYFGYIFAAFGISIIIGPAVGSYLMSTSYSYMSVAFFGIFISVITLISIILWLPETLQKPKNKAYIPLLKPFKIFSNFKNLKNHKLVRSALIIRFLNGATLASYSTMIIYFIIAKFNIDEILIGNFMMVVGFFLIFNQLFMIKIITKFIREFKLFVLSSLLMTIGLGLMTVAPNLYWLAVVYFFVNLGVSLFFVTSKQIVSKYYPSESSGEILGLEDAIGSLTLTIFPIIASLVFKYLGVDSFFIYGSFSLLALIFMIVNARSITKELREFKLKQLTEENTDLQK